MADSDSSRDSDGDARWRLGEVFGRPHDPTLVWFVLPAAATLGLLGLLPLRSWDYWWHLTMGRLINYWGAVPATNPYLYTVPEEAPAFVQPWLADLLLYGMHANGSVHSALVLRNLVVAAAVAWCGYRAIRRARSVPVGAVLTVASIPLVLAAAALGPSLFVWLLVPLLLEVCYRVERGEFRPAWLAVAPLAAAASANLHSAFWLAALFPALFGAARPGRTDAPGPDWSSWGLAAGAAAAAGVSNPRGWELYGHLAGGAAEALTGGFSGLLAGVVGLNSTFAAIWLVVCWVAAGALLGTVVDDADRADTLLVAGLGLSALFHPEATVAFALVLPVAAAPAAARALPDLEAADSPHPVAQRLYTFAAVACAAAAISTQPTWQWRVDWTANSPLFELRERPPLAGVAPADLPHEPVEVLARRVETPRLFHDRRYAGYLLYHLTGADPQRKVFIGSGGEFGPPDVRAEYERIRTDASAWSGAFDRYDVEAALLSRNNSELVEWMASSEEWSILMQGDHFTLVVPVDPAPPGE